MRDPARIDRILDAIRDVWKANPDLRLGQLVVNAIRPGRPCPEIFYAEDDRLQAGLSSTAPAPPPSGWKTLILDRAEAVVLLGILWRYELHRSLRAGDEAERQVLSNLFEALRVSLGSDVNVPDLQPLIEQAKRRVLGQVDPA